MELVFDWPPKALNPNSRGHWSKRAAAAKKYRQDCWGITKQSGLKIDWEGDIHLFITFYPPDKRHRDDDNCISMFKAGRDGMAIALGVNDKRFITHPFVSATIGGKIKVKITPRPQQ